MYWGGGRRGGGGDSGDIVCCSRSIKSWTLRAASSKVSGKTPLLASYPLLSFIFLFPFPSPFLPPPILSISLSFSFLLIRSAFFIITTALLAKVLPFFLSPALSPPMPSYSFFYPTPFCYVLFLLLSFIRYIPFPLCLPFSRPKHFPC